jgi:polyhydroxyalkanoate synthesis regulator phasin
MEKKLDNMTKVIQNPDDFNVNIASRERIDELEKRIKALEERMNGH